MYMLINYISVRVRRVFGEHYNDIRTINDFVRMFSLEALYMYIVTLCSNVGGIQS